MKAWYEARVDDESVTNTWKHLHSVLFKKVRVPYESDLWRQPEHPPSEYDADDNDEDEGDGVRMVVSAEFVAMQVKKVIERREKWLRDNNFPVDTLMNVQQRNAFLEEVKAEYRAQPEQLQWQRSDRAPKLNQRDQMNQRWDRECQRRAGTRQMWHLLSFYGRWDPSFFEGEPAPQHLDEQAEIKKRHTHVAIEARAKLKLATKYELCQKGSLLPDQEQLVASLHDGTLEAEAH